MAPGGGVMLGLGRTARDGKLRDYEFVRIVEADGSLAYAAEPSGQEKATFLLKSLTADEAVFENAAHDFPQRVIYRRLGADAVTGRIEGQIGGQAKSVDFPYKRCAPQPAIDLAPPVSMFRASYFDRVGTCATIAGI